MERRTLMRTLHGITVTAILIVSAALGPAPGLAATPVPPAPGNATYITQTPNASLTAEQALSTLGTGLLKNITGTGVLSIATPGTDYATASNITALQAQVTALQS